MTSRGYAVDLIESICEQIALSGHLREMLDGAEDKDKEMINALYMQSLKLRREGMEKLLELAEKPNPLWHCVVKHCLGAWWRAVEVYEATKEKDDYEYAKKLGDQAVGALSLYLGMTFEQCSRCFWDRILLAEHEHNQQKK